MLCVLRLAAAMLLESPTCSGDLAECEVQQSVMKLLAGLVSHCQRRFCTVIITVRVVNSALHHLPVILQLLTTAGNRGSHCMSVVAAANVLASAY